MQDLYRWQVRCKGSVRVLEYDNQRPDGRGFAEVKEPIECIDLIPTIPSNGKIHSVFIPDGASPVFFRRRTISLDGSANEQGRTTTHCIGWQKGMEKTYLFVFEDGSSLLTYDLQAV